MKRFLSIFTFLILFKISYSQQIGLGTGHIAPLEFVISNNIDSKYRVESKFYYYRNSYFNVIVSSVSTGFVWYHRDSSVFLWSGASIPMAIMMDPKEQSLVNKLYGIDFFFDAIPVDVEFRPKKTNVVFFFGIKARYFMHLGTYGGVKFQL